ncbi:hypothetical protein HK098_001737 [Nowakowskiella sp. JEL0407]|nr:hypothetical protein HK098_001737 [Nowakowskiella sp. JEL0407]
MNSTAETDIPSTHENKYSVVGLTLAITSGFFIGSSFIFKKRGLLDTNALGHEAGKGHAYLKSPMWWLGMTLMALGEAANFGAYAFSPAILVTPLGALSVVISAVLSSIFLNEKLNFSGKIGCAQSLFGALIIVFNASGENSTETLHEFYYYVFAPGFLAYSILILGTVLYLIYYASPKYGTEHPIVYISICSLVGSYLVLSTQGFGSSIVYSFNHWNDDNQFAKWQLYPLLAFVIFTAFVQINFLNKALNLFSTAIVTPVYYVFFTTATLVSSAVLFRGFPVANTIAGISILIGFLVIVGGVALLFQYSLKITKLKELTKKLAESGGNILHGSTPTSNKKNAMPNPEDLDDDDDLDKISAQIQNNNNSSVKRTSLKSEQIEMTHVVDVKQLYNAKSPKLNFPPHNRAGTAPPSVSHSHSNKNGVWKMITDKLTGASNHGYVRQQNLDLSDPEIAETLPIVANDTHIRRASSAQYAQGLAAMGLNDDIDVVPEFSIETPLKLNTRDIKPMEKKKNIETLMEGQSEISFQFSSQTELIEPKSSQTQPIPHNSIPPKKSQKELAPPVPKVKLTAPPTISTNKQAEVPVLPPPPKLNKGNSKKEIKEIAVEGESNGYINCSFGDEDAKENPW